MDNTTRYNSSDSRRSQSYIVLFVKGGQRMLEHWKLQRGDGNYSWTQVIYY